MQNGSTPTTSPAVSAFPRVAVSCLALAASGAAWSQGVTLSGIADSAARYVDNQGRGAVKSVVSGSNATSRIIIRGTEDLGDGLSAGFHLEHGLLLDTGTAASSTLFWDRRATVSLASRALGELRAGRDFVPSYVNWSRYDPFAYVGVASSSNLVSATPVGPIRSAFGTGLASTVRSSNSVQWLMPSGWGGVEGGLMVAAGEGVSAANGQHKVMGGRLGWAGGAYGISAAVTRSENDLTTKGAFQDAVIGGQADFSVVRVSAAMRRFTQADAKQTHLLIGAWVPFGLHEVKLSYNRSRLAGKVGTTNLDANGADQFGLGYVYNLSKRSALYATASRIDNRGAVALTIPGGNAGLAAGDASTGFEFGVRHSF